MDDSRLQPPPVNAGVAVIGMACTFPGARNIQEYWRNIVNKVDSIRDVTPDRWDAKIFYDPNPGAEDKVYCKKGGWIDTFAFNPLKYGVMPSAIEGADPDHFLVLRTAYEALEDARCLEKLTDRTRVNVILGKNNISGAGQITMLYRSVFTQRVLDIMQGLYPEFCQDHFDELKSALRAGLPQLSAEVAVGVIPNVCVGRVANRLGFMGSSFTVDAACASSLVAAELGIRNLLSGAADMVLVGGVHINSHLPFLQAFDVMRATSLSSTSRPFDEHADGTIVGEGIGILVLKRLPDAERDRDRIYAVIRGVGSSSDGRAKSVTAPRIEGEELALRRAYEMCGVSPRSIELLEGHGTGTTVGDGVEIEALHRVFGPSEEGAPTCALGSVKSMIGHAMPAAGAAGLIKAVLALYDRVLPPTINCRKPHPALLGGDSRFYVNSEARPWIHGSDRGPRRAGVNAFGFGGVNAHVVLEEYSGTQPIERSMMLRHWPAELVVIEAESPAALPAEIARLRDYAAKADGVALRDIAYTCNTSLKGLRQRISIVASSVADLTQKLQRAAADIERDPSAQIDDRQGIYYFGDSELQGGKVALLFPGEGSQYVNMLTDLCVHFPEVRSIFDQAESRLRIGSFIFPPPLLPERENPAAPGLWPIDVTLTSVFAGDGAVLRLLQALAIRPDMVTGHSSGEYVAMLAAGILKEDEFGEQMERVAGMYRALIEASKMQPVSSLAVGATWETIQPVLRDIGREAWLANDNCPHQAMIVVDIGDEKAILDQFRKRGILVEKLHYDRGYHTPLFSHVSDHVREYFSSFEIRPPAIPIYSCATGMLYPSEPSAIVDLSAELFTRPVLFRQTIETMYRDGARIFIEAGPRGNLTAFVNDILRGRPHTAIAVDRVRKPGITALHHALGTLAANHVPLDFSPLYRNRDPSRLAFDVQADRRPDPDREPGMVHISTGLPLPSLPPIQRPVKTPDRAPTLAGTHPELNPVTTRGGIPKSSSPLTPALEEHFTLMQDFLDTQEAVMTGYLKLGARAGSNGGISSAQTPDLAAAPALGQVQPLLRSPTFLVHEPGKSVTLRCEVDALEHRYLVDHCLYFPASDGNNQVSPVFCMPLTGSIELMAEAAVLLCPGSLVVGASEIRALRWINIKQDGPPTVLTIAANRVDDTRVQVTIRTGDSKRPELAVEGTIILGTVFPDPPPFRPLDFKDPRPPALDSAQYYRNRHTFHGPRFQGMSAFEGTGENGAIGRVRVQPRHDLLKSEANPIFQLDMFLLDAAAQVAGFWAFERLTEGSLALPIRLVELSIYRGNLPPGAEATSQVFVNEVSRGEFEIDIDITGPDGKIVMRATGWVSRRFYWSQQTLDFLRFADTGHDGVRIEIPTLNGSEVECSRLVSFSESDKTGLLEHIWKHVILHRREMAELEELPDIAQQTNWILRRAAAKDAIRRWIKRRYDRDLYPADVEITSDSAGNLQANGIWLDEIGSRPYVAACHRGPIAVGAASEQEIGIAMEPADKGLEHCARTAAARLAGADSISSCATDEMGRMALIDGRGRRILVHNTRNGEFLIALACVCGGR
jgi:acyl transferase domain-containing protein